MFYLQVSFHYRNVSYCTPHWCVHCFSLQLHISYTHPTKIQQKITIYLDVIPRGLAEREKSFMKQQFVTNHKVNQTEISTLLRQLGYEHTFCHNVCPQKFCLSLYFHTIVKGWSVGLLRINRVSSASCNAMYHWNTTNCCCKCEMLCEKWLPHSSGSFTLKMEAKDSYIILQTKEKCTSLQSDN